MGYLQTTVTYAPPPDYFGTERNTTREKENGAFTSYTYPVASATSLFILRDVKLLEKRI